MSAQQELDQPVEDCSGFAPDLSDLKLNDPGEGHNASLIREANRAYKMGATKGATAARLSELYEPDRHDSDTAPQRAVARAWEAKGNSAHLGGGASVKAKATLPKGDFTLLQKYARVSTDDIISRSPLGGLIDVNPSDIVKALFKPDDLICMETVGSMSAVVRRAGEVTEIDDSFKYLNSSTFLGKKATPGHLIPRTDDNVKDVRFMVLECDVEPKDDNDLSLEECVAIRARFNGFVLKLSEDVPLVMAVDTGGKSIHFWFHCGAWSDKVEKVFSVACAHGADRAMRILSQKARMPNVSAAHEGRRDQKLAYWDPSKVGAEWDMAGFRAKFTPFMADLSIYRDRGSKELYMQNISTGGYDSYLISECQLILKKASKTKDEIDDIRHKSLGENNMAGIFPLAGRPTGPITIGGGAQIFNPRVNRGVTPKEGSLKTTFALLGAMFPRDEAKEIQAQEVFLDWLTIARQSFTEGTVRHAQVLTISGDPQGGKSTLAKTVAANILGGAFTDGGPHMVADPEFNSDQLGEVLSIVDDVDMRGSKLSGEKIKDRAVNCDTFSIHKKFCDRSMVVPIIQRTMILTNTTEKAMNAIPALEKGVADKMVNLFADKNILEGYDDGDSLKRALTSEAAAFAFYLDHRPLPVPTGGDGDDDIKRYGCISYTDPRIHNHLAEGTDGKRALDAALCVLFLGNDDKTVSSTVSELIDLANTKLHHVFFNYKDPKKLGKLFAEVSLLTPFLSKQEAPVGSKKAVVWNFKRPCADELEEMRLYSKASTISCSEMTVTSSGFDEPARGGMSAEHQRIYDSMSAEEQRIYDLCF